MIGSVSVSEVIPWKSVIQKRIERYKRIESRCARNMRKGVYGKMSIRHILFDLDGTLLPMVQDEFVRFYMPLLAKAYMEKGCQSIRRRLSALSGPDMRRW